MTRGTGLVRVPEGAWGPLGGALPNLSYGTGKIFIVPHEEIGGVWQGAVCELPLPSFATGIMRGRFGADGALYVCGLFGWAGNATAPSCPRNPKSNSEVSLTI